MDVFNALPSATPAHIGIALVALIAVILLIRLLSVSLVYIPNTKYGVVERNWSLARPAEPFGLLAVNGGPGFLPEVLRGGWHALMPFQYRVHKRDLITVDQIGYLVARVGAPVSGGQALGAWPEGLDVEDARGFLLRGGQRGPQRQIVRSGTYAINIALFTLMTEKAIESLGGGMTNDEEAIHGVLIARRSFAPIVIEGDQVGVVTVQDGPALQHGEIIAPAVGTDATQPTAFHNSFQDVGRFLTAGGRRGRQEQVLVEGTYYINRLFATVETHNKTFIEIGTVGVVNSYVGTESEAPIDGTRGRTVPTGCKGVWQRPLEPGKYALNPYSMELTPVPITNFQLRWMSDGGAGNRAMPQGMNFDDDLQEIPVITKDAFEILIPLSIVAHIAPGNAPVVIQRFGKVQRLVNQTMDPLVSAYFKNVAQQHTLLELVQQRAEIGEQALTAVRQRLADHRIDIEEIMMGTPKSPPGDQRMESVFDQLRLRQVAREQTDTFQTQQVAATKERELNEARAVAEQQVEVTRSHLAIVMAENHGKAETARKREEAAGIRVMADAEKYAAMAKADAYGGPENLVRITALQTLADVTRNAKVPLVPGVLVASGAEANGGQGGLIGALMGMALRGGGVQRPDGGADPLRVVAPEAEAPKPFRYGGDASGHSEWPGTGKAG